MNTSHTCITRFYGLFVLLCITNSGRAHVLGLDEGEICKSSDDDNDYVCQYIENCTVAIEEIQKQITPQLCSFNGSAPIVCCPPFAASDANSGVQQTAIPKSNTATENASRPAVEMCREYSELIYAYEKRTPSTDSTDGRVRIKDCHYVQNYISGGTLAYPKEFPHMALLGYHEKVETNRWGCGGTLVSNRWILSAAHCERIGASRYALWARLGDLNYLSDTDDARPANYRIVRRVTHPDYKPPSVYHDIALFRLERDVQFSAYVRPVCLDADPSSSRAKYALATGWGQIEYDGPASADLLQVVLDVVPVDQCGHSYSSSVGRNLSRGIDDGSQLCAGHVAGGKDTCGGDSGGPLQISHPNYTCMYTQIGVTSFGKFCGKKNTPGVYTRVSNYVSWIEQIVWPTLE